MSTAEAARRARRALDERFGAFGAATSYVVPRSGWIRAVRGALGMSAAELAARLGMTRQGVAALETSEATGTIQLKTLRRAADALDCDLVYVLLPREGTLGATVDRQATRLVDRHARAVDRSMALEGQAVPLSPDARRAAIERLIENGDLWRVSAGS